MGDGMSPTPPTAPPPPPPPPPVVIEVRSEPVPVASADGTVMPPVVVPSDRRGNSDPVPAAAPPAGLVTGTCDRCGATATELVSWRVQITAPPQITLRGVCRSCATPDS